MAARSTAEFRPVAWPRSGQVQRLYINIAKGQAAVYVHQTAWPKQPQNPNWRIEVTDIDGRFAQETRLRIRSACEETARLYLTRWLADVAPLLTLKTITWPELARLATQNSYKVMSDYQKRRTRSKSRFAPARASALAHRPRMRERSGNLAPELDA